MNDQSEIDLVDALGGNPSFADRLTVYVPTKDKTGKDIDHSTWLKRTIDVLAQLGNGATVTPSYEGVWLGPNGEHVREAVTLVYTFVIPELFEDKISELRGHLHEMGRTTNQGAIAAEFSGQFFTIETYDG